MKQSARVPVCPSTAANSDASTPPIVIQRASTFSIRPITCRAVSCVSALSSRRHGAAAFAPSLTLDRPLFYRELADGCYTPVTYYLAKFIEEAVLASFTSLLFGVIVF